MEAHTLRSQLGELRPFLAEAIRVLKREETLSE
jgi:hypothetical protein